MMNGSGFAVLEPKLFSGVCGEITAHGVGRGLCSFIEHLKFDFPR